MTAGNIRIVVSGSSWMGGGLGSIESALHTLFAKANNDVIVVAYTISGAVTTLFQQLTTLLERGIRVQILINRYRQQHPGVQREMKNLRDNFPDLLQIYTFEPLHDQADLHAKIIIVDRRQALIGSANLSLRGLMDNHELGLLLEGPAVADVVRAVETLLQSRQTFSIN